MINKSIYKTLLLLLFIPFLLEGKVIEVEQLFNKKVTYVKEEKISIKKSFYGKTSIDESKVVDVVSRFDGFITSLDANKTFMDVKKGKKLFSIYSDEILAIQKEMQIARSLNKNLYRSAAAKLDALDLNKLEINKIKRAKIKSQGVNFYSPINAVVLKKNINKGSFVKKGKLLLQLANMEKLWFIAKVYQKDLGFLEKNMKAKIYIDGKAKAYDSTLDYIYPLVDEKNKTVDVRFIVDNKDLELYSNMFAKINIQKTQKTMLTLPKTAVLNKASKYYVFKPVSKTEFEPVLVTVKRINANKYEILSGLKKNDKVIDNALFLLDSDALTNALYESDDDDW